MKAVVIDDEINSRELLQEMLANYISGVELVGSGKNVSTGIDIIKSTKPDIVFLDIEMPGGDGFKILDAFEVIPFKVIFITGFQEYALKAIKYSALDYILKPISLEDLQLAIEKVKNQHHNLTRNYELLKSFQLGSKDATPYMAISGVTKQHFISIDKIMAVLIKNGSTLVVLNNGNNILSMSPLSHFESTLESDLFMRIHKSAMINLRAVTTMENGRTGSVHLKNGLSLPYSSRKKSELMKRLKDIF